MIRDAPSRGFSAAGVVRVAGHLAVWPGLYAGAVLLLLSWLTNTSVGQPDLAFGFAFVFLCGQAAYLLDRVKLSGARMDPSDRVSQPDRHAFLARIAWLARGAAGVELLLATIIGAGIAPWLVPVPVGVGVGVWLYAGRPADPSRPRPKDWPTAKAMLVAVAHTTLATVVLLATAPDARQQAVHIAEGCVILALLVFADAVVCDLDDLEADRIFGTRSVPVEIGARRSWMLAAATYSGCGLAVWTLRPLRSAVLLTVLLALSCMAAAVIPRRRDFIDARLIAIAGVCLWLG
jgi:4-hydroxybenzoate polyprenyltransferase